MLRSTTSKLSFLQEGKSKNKPEQRMLMNEYFTYAFNTEDDFNIRYSH